MLRSHPMTLNVSIYGYPYDTVKAMTELHIMTVWGGRHSKPGIFKLIGQVVPYIIGLDLDYDFSIVMIHVLSHDGYSK